ncbi:hypothetical protein [Blastococcus litoris]|uniref:hypothetical protein n=1 Tax=Blastococcus litoris TaxID=2171622 RepID=UPI000E30079D|nr:hypothetical protein [Blastococcus litoris]
MGYSGRLAYSDGRWTAGRPTAVPFLLVDVHDSRIATIDHRAADASGGRFFLGYEPRIYFEEPDASPPVDTRAEAEGFARWVEQTTGTDVDPDDVRRLLAAPDGAPPAEESVEETVEKLLALAGLPLPEWPTDDDAPAG